MTQQELVGRVSAMNTAEQIEWMIRFGAALTVTAREGYRMNGDPGSIVHLMACNEIQHRVLARVRDLLRGHVWAVPDFIGDVFAWAGTYEQTVDLGWALKHSLTSLKQPIC